MGNPINKITIKGFKSIRNLEDFELRNLNVLIGPNGAGKSNFISFFQLLRAMMEGNLAVHVTTQGGCGGYLFNGPKHTIRIETGLKFERQFTYLCSFLPTVNEKFIIEKEEFGAHKFFGGFESGLIEVKDDETSIEREDDEHLYHLISNIIAYHFHDTSDFAAVKRPCTIRDDEYLRPDASNLAAFLLFLKKKHEREYQRVRETIQLAAPFFDDFRLLEREIKDDTLVLLEWQQKGSDYPFHPNQMSDGTLRFICLVTALLQPEPPSTILLDEPELGLHPHALALLAEMIKSVSLKTQVIVSTQSATLIDYFEPQDIIVANCENGESKFRRLDEEKLKVWLEDYSLGELWQKNIFEDSPANE